MPDWIPQEYELKFQLSDLILFRARLPLLTHPCTLEEILAGQSPGWSAALPADRSGYLIRSAPGASPRYALETAGLFLVYTLLAYSHCYIDLGGSFLEYQGKFSSKTRNTIRRKFEKFTAHCGGQLDFRRYTYPSEMAEFYQHARAVSVRTYQERLWDLGLPEGENFLTHLSAAAERDEVRGYLLFHGGRPTAYLYCPVVGKTLLYAHLGFDPDYSEWSVGTLLLWLSLESMFEERRFAYLDFTEGDSPQKTMFSTHQTPCHNRLVLRNTKHNALLLRAHRRVERFSERSGVLFDRLGLKHAIRRLLRGTWRRRPFLSPGDR
jgi:hypothetical protein